MGYRDKNLAKPAFKPANSQCFPGSPDANSGHIKPRMMCTLPPNLLKVAGTTVYLPM